MRLLISLKVSEHRRFKELEEKTGVTSATWKSYWTTGTRPSSALIEAAAKHWPAYAFWLVTGIDDSAFGHTAPEGVGFPLRSTPQESSLAYFNAVQHYSQENDRIVSSLWDGDGELANLKTRDMLKRSGLVRKAEPESDENLLLVSILKDVRWVEILHDTYLPRCDYEETAAMLQVAKTVLARAESRANEHGITIDTKHIHLKIKDSEDGINRWLSWQEMLQKKSADKGE
ncbi:hypothetical protein hmeg3_19470 [Herbaspirillum sp. meg3]|nr:hypothetical protein hmeg3_19470 [Herbaspirillum sp. meg3]